MISDIQQKYEQLSPAQKEIFAGYGLRQVKHFVEINLPAMQAILPEQAVIQGINAQGIPGKNTCRWLPKRYQPI